MKLHLTAASIALPLALGSCTSMNTIGETMMFWSESDPFDEIGPTPELVRSEAEETSQLIDPITLKYHGTSNEFSPAVIDDTHVAFVSDYNNRFDIFYVDYQNFERGAPADLVSGDFDERAPAVGAMEDGVRRCFFVNNSAEYLQIYSIDMDNSAHGQNSFSHAPGHANWPDVSADGSKILYSVLNSAGDYDVHESNFLGTKRRRLLVGQRARYNPKNADQFVFTRRGVDGVWHVYMYNHATGKEVRLTSGDESTFDPDFSPDGQSIAYASNESGSSDIMIMDLKTNSSRRVTEGGAADCQPVWTPDGKYLLFSSDRGGTFDIYRVAVESRETSQP